MPSITSWIRLEPRSRNAEMRDSLQARIYDPLWLLARQWQLGEFQGEDNGSPIMARWRAEAAPLTRFYAGAIPPNTPVNAPHYDGARTPLETVVERERIRLPAEQIADPKKLRLAVEAGQHFLRLLEAQPLSQPYRTVFITRFAFSALTAEQRAALDPASLAFLDVTGSRVPDGRRLYATLAPPPGGRVTLPADLPIATADVAEVEKAAQSWIDWYEAFFSEPGAEGASWSAERMEYAFSLAGRLGDGERILTAPEYAEGRLDWYAFDGNAEVSLGALGDRPPTDVARTAIPAPVSFRGMPALRFWEFEDAQVDFGSVDAGPTDLARMLLVEFALAYGNDWFVIPVELGVGALYRTRSLVITDTFGVRSLIACSADLGAPYSTWRMFQHSYTHGSGLTKPQANLFFLAPSVLNTLESPPVEEVLLVRDEMANLAWAIERLIESPAEAPLNRYEDDLERERRLGPPAPAPPPSQSAPALRYRLASQVPAYWVPLLPVQTGSGLRLKRGAVLSTEGAPQPVHALGSILESGHELSLFEEEVPREGAYVTRSYQWARWIDGSSHLWVGRRKGVGRGESSGNLRFDTLDA
jgi:hypothetical protein